MTLNLKKKKREKPHRTHSYAQNACDDKNIVKQRPKNIVKQGPKKLVKNFDQ